MEVGISGAGCRPEGREGAGRGGEGLMGDRNSSDEAVMRGQTHRPRRTHWPLTVVEERAAATLIRGCGAHG